MSECGNCSGGDGSCSSCQENPQDLKIKKALGRIKNKIVVMSGKGGVGKSTVSTNIAVALSMAGMKVGLLDVDVHGPSIPRLLSLQDAKPHMERDCMEPVSWSQNLGVMSLGFLLPSKDDAVIWRGPVKIGLIRQFISDVTWGDLDFLIVDCPPGTGDEPLSALQELGSDAKAVIVTTPQGVAIDDVRRSVTFCKQVGNEIVGIVENMSGYVCSKCGSVENVFGAGGGKELAAETGVKFLGSIPMMADVARAGDEGFPVMKLGDHSPVGEAFNHIIKPLLGLAGKLQEQEDTSKPVETVLAGDNGVTRFAIPVAAGKLCMHFGHCEKFAILDVDNETKNITKGELLTPPPHEPGVLPRWLAEQKANVILAGGMGARAQSLFTENGIKVVVGAQGGDPEEIVNAYLAGNLTVGQNICDH